MVKNHYRWDFIGLSTDTKPTPDTSEKVADGSTFYESDTSKYYVWCQDDWYEKTSTGGGGGGGAVDTVNNVSPDANGNVELAPSDIGAQAALTAGSNITIDDGTISATDTTYTAGTNVSISSGNVISATNTTYSNFVGTDGTAAGTAGLVPAPATTDAGKFLKADGTWDTAGGDESPFYLVTFTGAYSSSNYSDKTVDEIKAAFDAGKIPLFYFKDNTWGRFYAVSGNTSSDNWKFRQTLIVVGRATGANFPAFAHVTVNYNSTQNKYVYNSLPTNDIVDTLTSAETKQPLSAKQGKVLKDLIDSLVIKNAGAPTTSTVGTVGMLLEDTTNGKLYQCTAVDNTDPQNIVYTWTEVGGSSGPTVVQTTGTSQTDVMSQDATSRMIYKNETTTSSANAIFVSKKTGTPADGSLTIGIAAGVPSKAMVAIGNSVNSNSPGGTQSVALGNASEATGDYSVAAGYQSQATAKGEFNIGLWATGNGYNNSAYRLLTGLYDPQSAHDAATKGYVDNAVINGGTTQPTTSTVGAVGTQYNCVNSGTPEIYICTDVTGGTYTWAKIN